MEMYVLGVSGSPTSNANTDKLVKAVMEATGARTDFVKLSEVEIKPCTACMKCTFTNRCVIEDDFVEITEMLLNADAVVVGSPTYLGSASAYTKAFMERIFAFRHRHLLMGRKVGAAIAVGSANEGQVADWIAGVMGFQGFDVAGSMTAKGTMCCMVCGAGETCAYANWNAYSLEFAGHDFGMKENYRDYLDFQPDNVPYVKGSVRIIRKHRNVEDDPKTMALAEVLGRRVRDKVKENGRA